MRTTAVIFALLISALFIPFVIIYYTLSYLKFTIMNSMNIPIPCEPPFIRCPECSGEGCIICDYYGEIPVTGEYLDDLAADKADEWYDNR